MYGLNVVRKTDEAAFYSVSSCPDGSGSSRINGIRPWKMEIADDTVYIGVKDGKQYKLYCISGEGEIVFEKPFVGLQ